MTERSDLGDLVSQRWGRDGRDVIVHVQTVPSHPLPQLPLKPQVPGEEETGRNGKKMEVEATRSDSKMWLVAICGHLWPFVAVALLSSCSLAARRCKDCLQCAGHQIDSLSTSCQRAILSSKSRRRVWLWKCHSIELSTPSLQVSSPPDAATGQPGVQGHIPLIESSPRNSETLRLLKTLVYFCMTLNIVEPYPDAYSTLFVLDALWLFDQHRSTPRSLGTAAAGADQQG